MLEDLTPVQRDTYEYMYNFLNEFDQLPTQACIAAHFEWKSPNAANEVLKILERKGWLKRNVLKNYMLARV